MKGVKSFFLFGLFIAGLNAHAASFSMVLDHHDIKNFQREPNLTIRDIPNFDTGMTSVWITNNSGENLFKLAEVPNGVCGPMLSHKFKEKINKIPMGYEGDDLWTVKISGKRMVSNCEEVEHLISPELDKTKLYQGSEKERLLCQEELNRLGGLDILDSGRIPKELIGHEGEIQSEESSILKK